MSAHEWIYCSSNWLSCYLLAEMPWIYKYSQTTNVFSGQAVILPDFEDDIYTYICVPLYVIGEPETQGVGLVDWECSRSILPITFINKAMNIRHLWPKCTSNRELHIHRPLSYICYWQYKVTHLSSFRGICPVILRIKFITIECGKSGQTSPQLGLSLFHQPAHYF